MKSINIFIIILISVAFAISSDMVTPVMGHATPSVQLRSGKVITGLNSSLAFYGLLTSISGSLNLPFSHATNGVSLAYKITGQNIIGQGGKGNPIILDQPSLGIMKGSRVKSNSGRTFLISVGFLPSGSISSDTLDAGINLDRGIHGLWFLSNTEFADKKADLSVGAFVPRFGQHLQVGIFSNVHLSITTNFVISNELIMVGSNYFISSTAEIQTGIIRFAYGVDLLNKSFESWSCRKFIAVKILFDSIYR